MADHPVSTGRGGAGNIESSAAVDAAAVAASAPVPAPAPGSAAAAPAFSDVSVGRGGAGNVVPAANAAAQDKLQVPDGPAGETSALPHHVGRGGDGNVIPGADDVKKHGHGHDRSESFSARFKRAVAQVKARATTRRGPANQPGGTLAPGPLAGKHAVPDGADPATGGDAN